ncbi:MAG: sulfatase [Spirochaetota bacterium]
MARTGRPNILWYCTDQQRFDTIRSLGNSHINTPNLDRLASEGVAFTRTYCQSPICTPSRGSFMTGRYCATTRVHRNGAEMFPDEEVLVSKMFADEDYVCGLVGKLHLSRGDVLERRPKDDGYHYYKWSHHPNPDYPEGHAYADWLEEKGVDPVELYAKLSGAIGPGVPDELHQTTWCTEMTVNFVTENQDKPWFININPFDPHPPFDPPPEYLSRYNPEEMPPPIFRESDIEHQKLFREIDQQTRDAVNPFSADEPGEEPAGVARGDLGSVPPKNYDPGVVKAYYYAMIEKIDQSVGEILDALEATGQRENTVVIFTSDHGELLGDHGLIYKGCRFFESLVHVPLIISWPGHFAKDARSDALVELVDLAPTVLEAAGLEIPYYVQGKSLMPLLTAPDKNPRHKDHVVSEYHGAIGGEKMPDQTHGTTYFDGRYKVCVYEGHDVGEIYDLQNDPDEFENLWFTESFLPQKTELVKKAFHAYLGTVTPGVRRTGVY